MRLLGSLVSVLTEPYNGVDEREEGPHMSINDGDISNESGTGEGTADGGANRGGHDGGADGSA